MELHVLDHPLVEHKLTVLRDKNTSSATFRELVTELVMLEAYEATRNLDIVDKPIETPVAPMVGKHIASPAPIIVPVLRAGLGMLDGMTKMIPTAEVGFLGMKRDEEHPTQQITYANRLPEDLTGRQCFLIDPMLATGGSAAEAIGEMKKRGCKHIKLMVLVAAPEGIKFLQENSHYALHLANVRVVRPGLRDGVYLIEEENSRSDTNLRKCCFDVVARLPEMPADRLGQIKPVHRHSELGGYPPCGHGFPHSGRTGKNRRRGRGKTVKGEDRRVLALLEQSLYLFDNPLRQEWLLHIGALAHGKDRRLPSPT